MSDKIVIVATITAKAGEYENLKAELLKLIEPSREEPGNISYELYRDKDNDNTLVMIEQFESEAAFEKHAVSEHFTGFVEASKPFLAELHVKKVERIA
ncbi:putative quinol monooxygenase [Pseudovibrio exalbescens]|uniref:ABM domain-containing protein n=1 Tax=Pseudovibrio exalbescens TaxID=197461 RepID=A0A1U7JK44_9HYPH|nr:putative quinol monooxygenase [Pseudovibrio exalbescens]OKL45075.1 hypothetical protein A3843_04795 [Pseudovibrio exalbescens]